MDLQLEIVPFCYYNTLGFDVALIDYINRADDTIKLKILYKERGRPLQATCDKQFEFLFEENSFFYDPVSQGSKLQYEMFRIRKQAELAFAHAYNQIRFCYAS